MHVNVLQENLAQALNSMQRQIPSKPSLPVLSCIWFQAKGQTITLGVTDLYMGILTSIPAEVTEEGTWAIPGKVFCETVSMMKAGKLELSLSDSSLTITSADSTTTIQVQSAEEYPAFPAVEGSVQTISSEQLQLMLDKVAFAVSNDVNRPVLTALRCEFEIDQLKIVATDGFRLATLVLPHPSETAQTLLLPAKALQELSRLVTQSKESDVKLTISTELKQVVSVTGSTTVFFRLIDGEYPPYQKIIPTQFTIEVLYDADEMTQQIKRALVFARESSQVIQLKLSGGKTEVIGTSPTAGTFVGQVSTETITPGDGTIAFNAKYLLDFLQSVKGSQIWFGMSESTKPALFRSKTDEYYQYVVMPFRLSS